MREICVDWSQSGTPLDRFYSVCVGAGRAGEMLRQVPLEQLEDVQQTCGFQYLRFHGLLHDEMGVYREDENGNPIYNWQYIDMVYDSLLERHIKPFVELSFTPNAMATGDATVFWWKANITPPKSYQLWYDLIHALVLHWEHRYGREELKTWYFEVWNEPNHPGFYTADMQEYFKLYDVSCRAVKDVCADYRVGGPATAGNVWIPEMIAHCAQNGVPLDFVSTHAYGVFGDLDETGKKELYLKPDKDCIVNEVKMVYDQVKASPMPNLEIHYTEWNSSFSPVDPVHDCYHQASYLLYFLKRLKGMVNSMSYWTYSDILEEHGVAARPFHGGFGLLNFQGYHKPAYYSYRFLNELEDTELSTGDTDSIAAKGDSSLQVLLWDYTKPRQTTYNRAYFVQDLPSSPLDDVAVKLCGLPSGIYRMELYQVGYGVNDIYTSFCRENFSDLPTREQTRALKKQTDGSPIRTERITVPSDGTWELHLPMRENDVYFLKFSLLEE